MPKPSRKKGGERIRIPYKYEPREYQKDLYNAITDGFKRCVAVWHRRAGKDKTLINIIAREMHKRVGSYYYFFPTYNQGRKILWDGTDKDGMRFMDHLPMAIREKTNEAEMKIRLNNGSLFQIIGTDNYNAVMGTNPVGCVFSEYSIQDPSAWDFIRPILAENGGWAIFIFTPRGKNHGWHLLQMAKRNPEWFVSVLSVDDTKAIPHEVIASERASGMSEDLIAQEFWVSFDASVPGAYFANEMRAAREQGRIGVVTIEPDLPVHTAWDLGIDDSTSIWFYQTVGREIHKVNYYSGSGQALQHYANYIKDWMNRNRVVSGTLHLPHDGSKRELQTGRSAQDFLKDQGFDVKVVERPKSKEVAIEDMRRVLGRCWFDEMRCERGIDCLQSYHSEYDEKRGVLGIHPVHDWASHGSDAFQTMAMVAKSYERALDQKKAEEFQALHSYSSGTKGQSWMGVINTNPF
jgi:hypothetical protein